MKKSLERLNSRFVLAKEQISILENRSIETNHSEKEKEKHGKKLTVSCACGKPSNVVTTICIMGVAI